MPNGTVYHVAQSHFAPRLIAQKSERFGSHFYTDADRVFARSAPLSCLGIFAEGFRRCCGGLHKQEYVVKCGYVCPFAPRIKRAFSHAEKELSRFPSPAQNRVWGKGINSQLPSLSLFPCFPLYRGCGLFFGDSPPTLYARGLGITGQNRVGIISAYNFGRTGTRYKLLTSERHEGSAVCASGLDGHCGSERDRPRERPLATM